MIIHPRQAGSASQASSRQRPPARVLTTTPKLLPVVRSVPSDEAKRWSSRWGGRLEVPLLRLRRHLPIVHAIMFAVFVLLVLVPPFLPEPATSVGPLDHLAAFANLALWGVWFPLVLASVLLTGRSWCGWLCPMGAASEAASKRGLNLPLPRWLTSEATPVLSFLTVTVLGQTLGVRDHPEAAAEVFGGLMALAIVLGFLYAPGKRPWCRHACPIGLLLGIFSRLGAIEFAPKRPQAGGDLWTDRGVCPTMVDLRRKTESRHCIACARCVSPSAKGGLYLRLRLPGEEIENIRERHPSLSEVWFLFLCSGLALGGFLWTALPFYQRLRDRVGAWFIDRDWAWIGEPGPWWLMSVHPERREVFVWLDFVMIVAFMLAVMFAVVVILAGLTAAASAMAGWLGGGGSFKQRFTEFGYQFAPVAMVSLLLGLGGGLFGALRLAGVPADVILATKILILLAAALWSVRLGYRIAARQGVRPNGGLAVAAPCAVGTLALTAAWWPALF